MDAQAITAALGGKWNAERHQGSVKCPAHEDRHPSATVSDGRNGRPVVHCHKSCSQETVLDALRRLDLWPSDQEWEIPSPRATNGTAHAEPEGRVVASYDYHDEAGTVIFRTIRKEPKDFRQWRPNGRGGWIRNLDGVRLVLYHLPDLLAADPATPVYIAEGEKDVDRLRSLGLVATTNPMGAKKWKAAYNEWLAGRHVVILPDNDPVGREHADQVARELAPVAATVRVVHLPHLPEKGDVSDWLDAGGTPAALVDLVRQIAPSPMPEPRYPIQTLAELVQGSEDRGAQTVEGIIWAARATWAFSDPATGKTLFLFAALMHAAAGLEFCGRDVRQCPVLVIEEDSPLSVAAEYVETLAGIYDFDLDTIPMWINRIQGLRLTDAEGIATALETIKFCPQMPGVVLLDACERIVPSDKFNTKELDPLTRFVQTLTNQGVAVIVIDHTNRARTEKGKTLKPMERLFGARAKSAISDVMLFLDGELDKGPVDVVFAKFRGEAPAPFSVVWDQEQGFSIPERPMRVQTSKGQQIRDWFQRYPDEWFSQAQVVSGTGVQKTTTGRWVASLVAARWLVVQPGTADDLTCYRLNPNLPDALDGFGQ